MASSDMASIDPLWSFRPSFLDPWFSEPLSRETQTLTKSLSGNNPSDFGFFSAAAADCLQSSDPFSAPPVSAKPEPPPTPAVSNVSGGSDPEPPAAANRRQRGSVPPLSGKVSKRKPRVPKRSPTTFITADPANFRQMVQQVTGVRLAGGCLPMQAGGSILKPEPQRLAGGRYTGGFIPNGCLPTLDTSAFLLNHDQNNHHQQQQQIDVGAVPPSAGGDAALSYVAMAAGGGDFDSYPSFPTLESWNAM